MIVYLHKRKNDNVVFYVGIGNTEIRAYNKTSRTKEWKDYIKEHEYYVEIYARDLDKYEAFQIESDLISKYGMLKDNTGSLVNKININKKINSNRNGIIDLFELKELQKKYNITQWEICQKTELSMVTINRALNYGNTSFNNYVKIYNVIMSHINSIK